MLEEQLPVAPVDEDPTPRSPGPCEINVSSSPAQSHISHNRGFEAAAAAIGNGIPMNGMLNTPTGRAEKFCHRGSCDDLLLGRGQALTKQSISLFCLLSLEEIQMGLPRLQPTAVVEDAVTRVIARVPH